VKTLHYKGTLKVHETIEPKLDRQLRRDIERGIKRVINEVIDRYHLDANRLPRGYAAYNINVVIKDEDA